MKVYNTLTGEKEEFIPLHDGKVSMYVCGPTTYNFIHLGNARPLVVFDTVRRYLEYLGYEVTYVQNFTDVDDKIIKKAAEEKIPPRDLAERYIQEYFQDADALFVKRASIHPRVSEHMDNIIGFIKGLEEKGFTYEVEGDVYYAVSAFDAYGKLSGRSLEDMQAGARVEVDKRKKNPADFALWKKAKPGEPSWDSPWGAGRPGWHVECSAMSRKYLGDTFDIHAGGSDLVFPHHENEIAQSEALTDAPMARYWLHNGFITVNQEKMSKSLGNFFLVRDILEKFSPAVVRFYLLATHYRSPLDFADDKLAAAQKGLERLQTASRLLNEYLQQEKTGEAAGSSRKAGALQEELSGFVRQFTEAMNDDFNTALAIAVLFDLARFLNTGIASAPTGAAEREVLTAGAKIYHELAEVLGLSLQESRDGNSLLVDELMALILEIRREARVKKDYQTADKIRDTLNKLGVILEDTPQGVRWRRQ
ncbi:MAG: cysteine--tRNA ligase [Clostridia bacterium]|nr:cysteine--tRNA ligase [Clostridia bacterium]